MFGLWFLVFSARGQFSIDWHKIAGGGGTSTNAQFSVSGTIGQHDAGPAMTTGGFSLTGGFWFPLFVVETPGSPLLSISLTSTNTAIVSWPSPSSGFTLQENSNGINTLNWSNVVGTPIDNGTIKYIIVDPSTGIRFFRLSR